MLSPAPTSYKNNIIVPIAVLPPQIPGKEPQLVCPAFIVPPGDWVIVWNLVTIHNAPLAHATFPEIDGISLLFGQDLHFTMRAPISDTQWMASIVNGPRDDKAKAFPLFYQVSFLYPAPGNPNGKPYDSTNRDVISHDPTIVVSQDPVEPT